MSETPAVRPPAATAPLQLEQFEPQTWKEAAELSLTLSKSAIIPRALQGRPSDVLVILMNGRELGLGPMQSLRQIYVVDGKPSMSAALKIGLCMRSPVCEYFTLKASDNVRATYETKRKGAVEPVTMTFTIDDAKKAGVAGKDNWTKYPAAMLRARCGSALAETVYPDVVGNLYDPDELGQEGPPPRRRANVPRVPQDEPAGEVVDAPPPADPTPPAPVAAAQAVNAPSVEFLAGKPPAPVSETGAMLEGMMQGPSETASAPKPPEPPADAPAAPAASNGVLRSMRGLTLEEWKLLTEEQRAASKDVTRKQCVLISSLAKSKGINDLALIMGELRNDFTREFDEFGIKELWQVDSRIASYAIDQLKATPF